MELLGWWSNSRFCIILSGYCGNVSQWWSWCILWCMWCSLWQCSMLLVVLPSADYLGITVPISISPLNFNLAWYVWYVLICLCYYVACHIKVWTLSILWYRNACGVERYGHCVMLLILAQGILCTEYSKSLLNFHSYPFLNILFIGNGKLWYLF